MAKLERIIQHIPIEADGNRSLEPTSVARDFLKVMSKVEDLPGTITQLKLEGRENIERITLTYRNDSGNPQFKIYTLPEFCNLKDYR